MIETVELIKPLSLITVTKEHTAAQPLVPAFDLQLDPLTESLLLQIERPTLATPNDGWTKDCIIRPKLVVQIGGIEYSMRGKVTGGERLDSPVYELQYFLPVVNGEHAADFMAHTEKDERGFWNDVPLTRAGFNQTLLARLEFEYLDGPSMDLRIIFAAAFAAEAPKQRIKNSVAFQAAGSAKETAGDGTFSFTGPDVTGSELFLFGGAGWSDAGAGDNYTSMSWNGAALTEKWDIEIPTNTQVWTAGLTLVTPDTGANSVVSTVGSVEPPSHFAGVISATGVHQTVPVGTAVTATGTSSPASVSVSGENAEGLIFDSVIAAGTSLAVGANQTSRNAQNTSNLRWLMSTQSGADGALMTETIGIPDYWGTGAIEAKPSGAAPTILRQMMAHAA